VPGGEPKGAHASDGTALDFTPVGDDDSPEIIECAIRLHSSRPPNKADGEPSWTEWSQTVVGAAVTFQAIAIPSTGAWNGPLSPGVEIAPPVALDDPYWTVFLPDGRGVPILTGQVGRPLGIGEAFALPPGTHGVWTQGVVFDGTIITD
jgi:hypothetical protein